MEAHVEGAAPESPPPALAELCLLQPPRAFTGASGRWRGGTQPVAAFTV